MTLFDFKKFDLGGGKKSEVISEKIDLWDKAYHEYANRNASDDEKKTVQTMLDRVKLLQNIHPNKRTEEEQKQLELDITTLTKSYKLELPLTPTDYDNANPFDQGSPIFKEKGDSLGPTVPL